MNALLVCICTTSLINLWIISIVNAFPKKQRAGHKTYATAALLMFLVILLNRFRYDLIAYNLNHNFKDISVQNFHIDDFNVYDPLLKIKNY